MKGRGLAAILTVALLAGCARKAEPPLQRPAPPAQQPEPVLLPQSPADYVSTSASYDLFVIRASELVLRRSLPERTRRLAERLRYEHRGLASQLSMAGRRLNLLPRPVVGREWQLRLDHLATTGAPEQVYWQYMIAAHREVVRRHRAFTRGGQSPTLRAVAANALRVEEQHLAALPPR